MPCVINGRAAGAKRKIKRKQAEKEGERKQELRRRETKGIVHVCER